MHILLNTPSPDELRRLDDSLEDIERMPGRGLRRRASAFQAEYEKIVEMYGVRGSVDEFQHILDDYERASKPIMYIAKHDLTRLFTRYENRFPVITRLPPHGRVAIEVGGRKHPKIEMGSFLLEASLFEDMAALWNAAAVASEAESSKSSASETKHAAALRRATAKAAFNLMEGYVNGLALDVQLLFKVSAKEKTLLQEWDDTKNVTVRLSLRDKILQYVKLAARAQHPPLQESNSYSMRVVLETEAAVRHALIHPTPRLLPGEPLYRETTYLNLSLKQVEEICDAIVALIREISAAVGPAFGDVSLWLFDRDVNNRYPDATFV